MLHTRMLLMAMTAAVAVFGLTGEKVYTQTERPPTFEHDPSWPKPLPDKWRLGIVWGIAVDPRDHVWVLHAPDNYRDEIEDEGKVPAPPVLEFDPEGNLVRAWGGRDQGHPWFYRMDSQRLARVDDHVRQCPLCDHIRRKDEVAVVLELIGQPSVEVGLNYVCGGHEPSLCLTPKRFG